MSELPDSNAQVEIGKTVLGPLEWVLSVFVALVLFYLMALRCVDVVGRYGFNAPVPGASELTGLGLSLLIFGALPIVTARSEHVSVSLLHLILLEVRPSDRARRAAFRLICRALGHGVAALGEGGCTRGLS